MSGLDASTLDWASVERAVFSVRHHYRYVYTAPVFDLKQRLIMLPPDRHADQHLETWTLDVRGASGRASIDWSVDPFGNRVCSITAEHVEHAIDFEARFRVRRARCGATHEHVPEEALHAWRSQTALTAPDDRIREAAREIAARASTPAQQTELAHDWVARAIAYQVGVTGTQTPAAMALHLGRGVCQDYAHIMLSLLRSLGIAARYVSGHLLGEGAPHAWIEALQPTGQPAQYSVVAYDPTHHRCPGLNYLNVAVGRDFADVTMTSGVFSGAASGRLHWSKHAEVVHVGRDGEAEEAAA